MLTSILSIIVFSSGCSSTTGRLPGTDESDWQRMELHGRVRSLDLYEVSWEEAFGKLEAKLPGIIDQSTVFSTTGNQVESAYYTGQGALSWKDVFLYDNGGETWSECVSYYEDAGTWPQWSYTNFYDDQGRISKVEGFDYNDDGQKLSAPTWIHIYEYREDEAKIIRSSYSANGTLQWENISKYNAAAMVASSSHYDDTGAMKWRDIFKYDNKGNRTEWARFNSRGVLQWRDEFKYDINGNETECLNYDYENRLLWKAVYLYLDETGLTSLDIRKSADLENSFDIYGNWTYKITLEEKRGFDGSYYKVKEVEKRSLTYFP